MTKFSLTSNETTFKDKVILYEKIVGSRRFSNFFWAFIILLGSFGFLVVGLSSFFKTNLVFFLHAGEIVFFPQGLVMSFYGFFGIFLGVFQWLLILWKIGEGYNEFNREKKTLKVFRWGFPGRNRQLNFVYFFEEIEAVRVEIKEGINPKRIIYSALLAAWQKSNIDSVVV